MIPGRGLPGGPYLDIPGRVLQPTGHIFPLVASGWDTPQVEPWHGERRQYLIAVDNLCPEPQTKAPLVLCVLAIANGIHIASRYQRTLNETPDRRMAL